MPVDDLFDLAPGINYRISISKMADTGVSFGTQTGFCEVIK